MTVEILHTVTTLDINPDQILKEAQGKLGSVVLIGYDKEGEEYFASSTADGGDVLWLMERAKLKLLTITGENE